MAKRTLFRTDPLERFDGRGTLGFVSAILGFAVLFLGSPAQSPATDMAVGSADMRALSIENPDAATTDDQPKDEGLWYQVYVMKKGDTVSQLAETFDITVDTLINFNNIKSTRSLRTGTYLKIPNMIGLLYDVSPGDTLASVAAKYEISSDRISEVNKLFSENLPTGRRIFLPDARLSSFTLREINGDLFKWPIRGYITDRYGWRDDPFSGARSFHTGIDIGAARGTPVGAAMEGRVIYTGYNTITGNHVIVSHHSGYATLYAHLDRIDVLPGQWVSVGTRIGAVGNTGYSTGCHLHFTVLKNGRTINPMQVLH
jgi:murein DD-endopeptidase MepM/ murein hydrolase activator NlpD